jgi:long-subunit fatty acid transport protein
VLSSLDTTLRSGFLHSGKATSTLQSTADTQTGGSGTNVVVQAGTNQTVSFNAAGGDKLDLSQILAGAPLTQDLTNVGKYVKVAGYSPSDQSSGQGVTTTFDIAGPNGHAVVNLNSDSKLSLDDLLKHNSLIPPGQ